MIYINWNHPDFRQTNDTQSDKSKSHIVWSDSYLLQEWEDQRGSKHVSQLEKTERKRSHLLKAPEHLRKIWRGGKKRRTEGDRKDKIKKSERGGRRMKWSENNCCDLGENFQFQTLLRNMNYRHLAMGLYIPTLGRSCSRNVCFCGECDVVRTFTPW